MKLDSFSVGRSMGGSINPIAVKPPKWEGFETVFPGFAQQSYSVKAKFGSFYDFILNGSV